METNTEANRCDVVCTSAPQMSNGLSYYNYLCQGSFYSFVSVYDLPLYSSTQTLLHPGLEMINPLYLHAPFYHIKHYLPLVIETS